MQNGEIAAVLLNTLDYSVTDKTTEETLRKVIDDYKKLHDAFVYRNKVRRAIVDIYEVAHLQKTAKKLRERVRSDGAGRPRVLITGCPNTSRFDDIRIFRSRTAGRQRRERNNYAPSR